MTHAAPRLSYRWLTSDDPGGRAIRGGLLAVGAQVCRTVVQVGLTAILARLLLPRDFGLIAIAAGIIGIGSVIAELGLTMVTIQRRDIDDEISSGFFYVNVLTGLVMALAIAGLAPVLSIIFGQPRLTGVTQALAGTIPVFAASRQPFAILQREMRWPAVQAVSSLPPLISGFVAAGLAATGFGASSLIAQAWASAFLTLFLCWRLTRWWPGQVRQWRRFGRPLREGLSLSVFSLASAITGQADDLLLGWRWGTSTLGFYGRAQALIMLPSQLLIAPISSALLPALSRLQDNPAQFARLYLRGLSSVMIVAGISSALIVALARPLIGIVLGSQWQAAASILQILGFSILPLTAANAAAWLYIASGHARRLSRWALVTVPIWLCGFALALPFGAKGVAVAFVAVAALLAPVNFYHATRGTSVKPRSIARACFGPLLISLTCGTFGHVGYVQYATGAAVTDLSVFGIAIAAGSVAGLGGLWWLSRLFRSGVQGSGSTRS